MIEVKHLSKSFGDFQALDDINMHIEQGSVYGLVGPNGAGKSTLIRHLSGVYRPDSGSITVNQLPVYENPDVKQHIICIPDELFYFPQANTLDMKNFYKGLYHNFDEALFERMAKAFPAIDVHKNIRRLSKGMQKQVIFWISICCRPDFMILDEPVDGLDPVMRRQIWSILLAAVADRQMTVLISSHNLRELEDVCDCVGIMHQGKLLLENPLADLETNTIKYQVVYAGETPQFPPELDILEQHQTGHACTLIIRGKQADVTEMLQSTNPLTIDVIPISLEEIFIYELGGMNYELKDILF